MKNIIELLIQSWATTDSKITSTKEILQWIKEKNKETAVEIQKIPLDKMNDWLYSVEEGVLRNKKGAFFKVAGFRAYEAGNVMAEQPILIQPENGYLGIICKKINGILHFLMQAKIEPGNINKIQISPTIQATKSNFTQAHGGKKPAYLDYFLNANRYHIILDQLQSEQSARFLKKRNRNMLIYVEEDIELLPNYCWMTLGQIKELMCNHNNLVNMDTRTVLGGIPFSMVNLDDKLLSELFNNFFVDKPFFYSIFYGNNSYKLPEIYNYINNYKMFVDRDYELLPLHQLKGWKMEQDGIFSNEKAGFQVIYCKIEIEGREVQYWSQPLFEAVSSSTFGLICCDIDGIRNFLVQAVAEPGSFDRIELGPSIQLDVAVSYKNKKYNHIERLLDSPDVEVLCDVLLSEEGGRFYHEQNRNVLLKVTREQIGKLPEGYFLLDYKTLNYLYQINNCLNIQLRNLLSLLRIT